MKKTDVLFHETFPPQSEYISALLKLGAAQFCGTKEEISEITGIPTGKQKGKVVPHIKYAAFMGLLSYSEDNKKYSLQLTELGQKVVKNDPFLFENITKQVCHFNLSDQISGASLWSYLLYKVPHVLEKAIGINYVKDKMAQEFGFQVELGVVKSSYIGGFFDTLDFINWDDKNIVFQHSYVLEQNIRLYAYTLLTSWEKMFPSQSEVTIDDITEVMKWGVSYGFDREDVMMALDMIAQRHNIQVNRQLFPITVARLQDSSSVLNDLYADLI